MSDALSRYKQLVARSELPQRAGLPAVPGRAPGSELIRYAMGCSVYGWPFVVVAEAHGDRLKMLRNEPAGGRNNGGPVSPPPSLGSFSFDASAWQGCPHCGARDNPAHNLSTFWRCNSCGGFNCAGDNRGSWRCACGNIATSFYTVEKFEVYGTRAGGATPPRAAPTPAGAIRPAPFVAPAAAPRFSPGPSLPPTPPSLRLPGRK